MAVPDVFSAYVEGDTVYGFDSARNPIVNIIDKSLDAMCDCKKLIESPMTRSAAMHIPACSDIATGLYDSQGITVKQESLERA